MLYNYYKASMFKSLPSKELITSAQNVSVEKHKHRNNIR